MSKMAENSTEEKGMLITKIVKVPIPFFFNLAANTSQTLVSSPISVYYKIKSVEAHFRDDANHNLLFYIFNSNNRTLSTTTPPPDDNVVSSLSPTPYLAGEGEIIELPVNYEPPPNYMYIKVFAQNNNAYAITGLCVVTIEGRLTIKADEDNVIPTTEEMLQEMGKAQEQALARSSAVMNIAASAIKGTPPITSYAFKNLSDAQEEKTSGLVDQFLAVLNVPQVVPATMPKENRYKTSKAWFDTALKLTYDTMNLDGLIGILVSALGGTTTSWRNWLTSCFGVEGKINELLSVVFEKGLLKPVEQYWNSIYLPEYPTTADLINMVVKEVITLENFKAIMKYQGLDDKWSQDIWDAHFVQPDFTSIKTSINRGIIPPEEIDRYLKLVDLDPRYNDVVWKPLLQEIPPYSDLINMRVKEVIEQDKFEKALQSHGFYGEWAANLWAAHFTPPTFTDILTAFRRGEQTQWEEAGGVTRGHKFGVSLSQDIEAIKDLSVLVDYDPRYWSLFKTRIYNDPTVRQARWGYESGAISEEKLKDVALRSGLTPEDAEWFTQFQTTFQERPFITRYLNALMSAYISKAITAEELKKRVKAIPRREAIADWIIKIADVQTETAANKTSSTTEKLLSAADLKKAYTYGLITEDKLRTELQLLGYPLEQVDLLIEIINKTKEIEDFGGRKTALTVSEMFEAWRYGEMSESDLRTGLQVKGMTLVDIDTLISARKTKWGIS